MDRAFDRRVRLAPVIRLSCSPRRQRALAGLGLRRILVEGGGITVSRFVAARRLARLQLTIAPVLIGSGRSSLVLAEIDELRHALRMPTRSFRLGEDTLVDCLLQSPGEDGASSAA